MRRCVKGADALADQVGRADAEERALGLGRDGLGQVRLASTGRTVEQDAAPGRALAGKELRELDRQDDGLLERLLGAL